MNVSLRVDAQSGLVGECGWRGTKWTPTTSAVSSLTPFIHIYLACLQTQIQPCFHVFIFIYIYIYIFNESINLLFSPASVFHTVSGVLTDRMTYFCEICMWLIVKSGLGGISLLVCQLLTVDWKICIRQCLTGTGGIFKACQNSPLSLLLASWAELNEVSVTGAAHSIASIM